MKKITYICVALSVALSSCNKKETLDPQSVIHDDTDTPTALDTYIQNEYINPYNIEVNYKYVDINYEMDATYIHRLKARYSLSWR